MDIKCDNRIKQRKLIMMCVLGAVIICCFVFFCPELVCYASTGVDGLDGSLDRGESLIEGIVKTLGRISVIIGLVLGGFGFFGHQQDMKAQAPVWIGVGLLFYFSPEIADFLVG